MEEPQSNEEEPLDMIGGTSVLERLTLFVHNGSYTELEVQSALHTYGGMQPCRQRWERCQDHWENPSPGGRSTRTA
jgi:hypothetical protein